MTRSSNFFSSISLSSPAALFALTSLLCVTGCESDDSDSQTDSQTSDTAKSDKTSDSGSTSTPRAKTSYGEVEGYKEDGIAVFKGIRYGADTSTTRFEAPKKPAAWTDVKPATAFGDSCPQTPTGNPGGLFTSWAPDPTPGMSEDCLFLNVWTPAVADGKARPVMVWLHGGGFTTGNGSSKAYDGVRLSKRGDVVVVTVNHRLNVFGYLALSHYGKGFEDSAAAGLLDLVQALQWVKDNAKAFGGDPGKVTIFGESGGGAKVTTLLATEAAKGLFHRAIVQSGAVLRLPDETAARAEADKVVQKLGLSAETIAQIKTLPEADIRAALMGTAAATAPSIDGRTLTRQTFTPDAPPSGRDVPLMLGTNRTENSLFAGPANMALFDLTWEGLSEELSKEFPDQDVAAIIAGYKRLEPEATPADIYFEATTDANYLAGHRLQAERKVAQGGAPTYLYLFNWNTPVQGGKWRSPHALEIGFVFDNVAKSESMSGVGDAQQRVADVMSETWLAFARNGDPNHSKLPNWPAYDTDKRPVMVFDETPELVENARGEQVALFGPNAGLEYGNRYQ